MSSSRYELVERVPAVEDDNRVRGGAGLSIKDPRAARRALASIRDKTWSG